MIGTQSQDYQHPPDLFQIRSKPYVTYKTAQKMSLINLYIHRTRISQGSKSPQIVVAQGVRKKKIKDMMPSINFGSADQCRTAP